MHFEQSAILTVHNHVITRNPRISVTHDKHDKHKTWFLHITNVQEEDKGRYMCQINTVTAKTQFGYLHVVGKVSIFCVNSINGILIENGFFFSQTVVPYDVHLVVIIFFQHPLSINSSISRLTDGMCSIWGDIFYFSTDLFS